MNGKPKILLAEDEINFGTVLKQYLELHDFDVTLCPDGYLALGQALKNKFDLFILDVMMPNLNGFELASELISKDKDTPILFLTARSLKEDMIKGFEIGADDYLTKPFDSEILLHKIKAVLKRNKSEANDGISIFEFGELKFDYKLRVMSFREKPYKLSPKESSLFKMLCEHRNDILPRRKALLEIWKDDSYFTTRSMDVYITKLRKRLSNFDGFEIENIHGEGYRLIVQNNNPK